MQLQLDTTALTIGRCLVLCMYYCKQYETSRKVYLIRYTCRVQMAGRVRNAHGGLELSHLFFVSYPDYGTAV